MTYIQYSGSSISDCKATNGGGMYAQSADQNKMPSIEIQSTIYNNVADNGGGVYLSNIYDQSGHNNKGQYVKFTSYSYVYNNTANKNGSALYCYYCNKIILSTGASLKGSLYFVDYTYTTTKSGALLMTYSGWTPSSFSLKVDYKGLMKDAEYYIMFREGNTENPGLYSNSLTIHSYAGYFFFSST